jgi:hypothetical protein
MSIGNLINCEHCRAKTAIHDEPECAHEFSAAEEILAITAVIIRKPLIFQQVLVHGQYRSHYRTARLDRLLGQIILSEDAIAQKVGICQCTERPAFETRTLLIG